MKKVAVQICFLLREGKVFDEFNRILAFDGFQGMSFELVFKQ